MEDEKILALYEARNEAAIVETNRKYGSYCGAIAYNILMSYEDSDECVQDTWLKTWNAIPPEVPRRLKSFVGRITHNLAIDRYRKNARQSRCTLDEVLAELQVPELSDPEQSAEEKELGRMISDFLRAQPSEKRVLFVRRYWYVDSISEISRKTGMKEDRIRTELYRMRKKLRICLEKEGYTI